MRAGAFLLALPALAATPVTAQPAVLSEAIQAGQVGERYDGYMGFVMTPPPQLRRQVDTVNLRRRNLYIQLAERRNVNPQLVGMVTACQLLSQLPAGEAYMLNDGAWRRRAAAPIALPDYCR